MIGFLEATSISQKGPLLECPCASYQKLQQNSHQTLLLAGVLRLV